MIRRRWFIGASLGLAAMPAAAQERPIRFSVTGSLEQGSLAMGSAPPGSVAALDGTMRRRLRSDALAGQAHIKTGSLNDVRSIAGYVLSASGQRHAVVCFIQHANAQAGQAAQDALLRWVYELPSEPGANPAAATPPATTTPPARTPARRTERPHAAPAPHRG
jgi:hypothetical protein